MAVTKTAFIFCFIHCSTKGQNKSCVMHTSLFSVYRFLLKDIIYNQIRFQKQAEMFFSVLTLESSFIRDSPQRTSNYRSSRNGRSYFYSNQQMLDVGCKNLENHQMTTKRYRKLSATLMIAWNSAAHILESQKQHIQYLG